MRIFSRFLGKHLVPHKIDIDIITYVLGFGVYGEPIRFLESIVENLSIPVHFHVINLQDAHPSTIIVKLFAKYYPLSAV